MISLRRLFKPRFNVIIDDGHCLLWTDRRLTAKQREACITAFYQARAEQNKA